MLFFFSEKCSLSFCQIKIKRRRVAYNVTRITFDVSAETENIQRNSVFIQIFEGMECGWEREKLWIISKTCVCVVYVWVFCSFASTFSELESIETFAKIFLSLFSHWKLFKIQVYFETEFFQWLSLSQSGGRIDSIFSNHVLLFVYLISPSLIIF